MAGRIADRPHAITILLSLIAAYVSGIGVYVAYQKSVSGSSSQPIESKILLQSGDSTDKANITKIPPEGQKPDDNALEMAKKSILGGWTCSGSSSGEALKEEGVLPGRVRLRQCKYLNNVVEQDHRTVKKRTWQAKGYGSFLTAWRTLQGIEQ
jgi:hypothetical protein